ncbi:MAG: sodium/solute symporter [Lentisphaeria bacterium]|nr:sodium/solute symporter [Lentisphaeria bacterium]
MESIINAIQAVTWKQWVDYGVIALYTLVVIGIGIYFSKEKKDSETYLLGGRTMPSWAIGLACLMSLFSSISIVMVPGEIFNTSMTLFVVGGFVGPLLIVPCYLLFTKFYFRLGSFTPYEYLEYRYDKGVRGIVAISAFFTRIIYIGMVLYTSAKIFEAGYGWAPWFSILLVAIVGIVCCFIGGSKAVVWTDVFQAIITFGGLLAVAVMLCWKIDGGLIGALKVAVVDGHFLPDFTTKEFYTFTPYVRLIFILLLWGTISTHLTNAASDQVTIQRILSTKNWKEGLKAQLTSAALGVLFMCFLYFIGLALYTYYKQCPDAEIVTPPVGAPEGSFVKVGDKAFFHFVAQFMPVGLAGLFMAAMLAAIMSTVSGVTNSMAAVWLKEFHQKFIDPKMDGAKEFRVLRASTLIIGAVGILVALAMEFAGKWLQQSVSEVSTIFWVLGAAILPAFLFAVCSKRANSLLIWAYTFAALGETIAYNVWYAVSKDSLIAWQDAAKAKGAEIAKGAEMVVENMSGSELIKLGSDFATETVGFGWAGKMPYYYIGICAIVAVVLIMPYFVKAFKANIAGKVITTISACLGLIAVGATEVMVVWCLYSNFCITTEPLARSFQFAPPFSLILAVIALLFCPVQPKKKWQGLILSSVNDPIIKEDEEEAKAE